MTEQETPKRRHDDCCPVTNCRKPEDAAEHAVKQVFAILGVNVEDPQQVEEFRKGLRFGEALLDYSKKGLLAFLTAGTTLIVGYIMFKLTGFPIPKP